LTLSEEVLRQGHALVLFPEGGRRDGPTVKPLLDGAMFVAARTGAVVVPVGIGGSENALPPGAKIPRPAKVRIVVGLPINPAVSEGRIARSLVSAKSEELRVRLQAVYRESLND
jgi:1-acyl-sn-glycerol-3-phosphate acyltransferase